MTSQPQVAAFEGRGIRQIAPTSGPARVPFARFAAYGLAAIALFGAAAACAWYFLLPPALAVVEPRIGTAVTAVYGSGTVEASVMLPVAPRVGARLIALLRDESQSVRKGQVLARLESEDLAGNIAQLKANAEFARTDMERDTRLMNENAIARQVYDRAVANWNMAQAAVRQAEAQADFMALTAPDDCTVIQRDGEIGQFIAANTPIFWLSCHSILRVSAQVDEEDIPMVRPGQKVLIRADAFPGKVFEAQVSDVTPKGDPVGRSYRVRINLPPGNPLQIGMTTEVNIVVSVRQNALLLPAGAVSNGKVWKIVRGRAVRAPVVTGAKDNDTIEVVNGIARSELVLQDGSAAPPPMGFRTRPAGSPGGS